MERDLYTYLNKRQCFRTNKYNTKKMLENVANQLKQNNRQKIKMKKAQHQKLIAVNPSPFFR